MSWPKTKISKNHHLTSCVLGSTNLITSSTILPAQIWNFQQVYFRRQCGWNTLWWPCSFSARRTAYQKWPLLNSPHSAWNAFNVWLHQLCQYLPSIASAQMVCCGFCWLIWTKIYVSSKYGSTIDLWCCRHRLRRRRRRAHGVAARRTRRIPLQSVWLGVRELSFMHFIKCDFRFVVFHSKKKHTHGTVRSPKDGGTVVCCCRWRGHLAYRTQLLFYLLTIWSGPATSARRTQTPLPWLASDSHAPF